MKAHAKGFPGQGGDPGARAGGPGRRVRDGVGIPVVILFAVNAAVLGEAGELGLERQLTFTALQAPQVPLLVHGQQVVPVGDLAPAAGAQGGLLRAQRGHALQGSARAVRSARGRPTRVPGAEPAPGLRERRRVRGPSAKADVGKRLQLFLLPLVLFLPRPSEPGLNLKTLRSPRTVSKRARSAWTV